MGCWQALASGIAFALLAAAPSAHAALALRHRLEARGDLKLLGNTLAQECATDAADGAEVAAPLVGTLDCSGTNDVADTAPDVFWRSDFPVPGQAIADASVGLAEASSSASLELPAGARPVYARLYWAGYLDDASGAADAAVVLETSVLRSEVAADVSNLAPDDDGVRYQSSADVTALLADAGSTVFRVSGVESVDFSSQVADDDQAFSAWWMVVFYADDGAPIRTLALYDGLDRVDDQTLSSTLANELGVLDAGFDAQLGIVAFEGDASLNGDALLADGVALSDALNPADDFFNATRSELGLPASRAGDLPRLSGGVRSMSGLDLDLVDITAQLAPGQSSLTIQAESNADTFFLGGLVSRVSQLRPDFSASLETYRDLDAGVVARGDEIELTLAVRNTGSDASAGTELTDTLAAGLDYAPGSIRIESNGQSLAQSDAAGDDLAEFDPALRELRVRLGAGASATSGGAILPGESLAVTLRAKLDLDAPARIEHQATVRASGLRGGPEASFASDADLAQVGAQPTLLDVQDCELDADCNSGAPRCDVAEGRYDCVACLEDADCRRPESPVCLEQRSCGCPHSSGRCPPDDAGLPPIPDAVVPEPDAGPDREPRIERLRGSGFTCGLSLTPFPGGSSPQPAPRLAVGLLVMAALLRARWARYAFFRPPTR